jgi:hypothetical protein
MHSCPRDHQGYQYPLSKGCSSWEQVLESLSGYMLLAQKMWDNPTEYCEGWNFGPEAESVLTVWEVASAIIDNFALATQGRKRF